MLLAPELASTTPLVKPPSVIIKEAFEQLKGEQITDDPREKLAKLTLLSPSEVGSNIYKLSEKAAACRWLKKLTRNNCFLCVYAEKSI